MQEVDYLDTNEVVKALKTTHRKLSKAILNHTLPIGFVTEAGDGERTVIKIVRARYEKWINGEL